MELGRAEVEAAEVVLRHVKAAVVSRVILNDEGQCACVDLIELNVAQFHRGGAWSSRHLLLRVVGEREVGDAGGHDESEHAFSEHPRLLSPPGDKNCAVYSTSENARKLTAVKF